MLLLAAARPLVGADNLLATPPGSPCGDGACDAFEQAHPDACPQDCAAANPPPPAGYCGDGACDAFETANPGACSQDCDAAGPPGSSYVSTAAFTVDATPTDRRYNPYLFGIQALKLDGSDPRVRDSGFKVFATHAPAYDDKSAEGYSSGSLASMDLDLAEIAKVDGGQPWLYFYQLAKPSSMSSYYSSVRSIAQHIKSAHPGFKPVFFLGNEPDWEVRQCSGAISSATFKNEFWSGSRRDFFETYEQFSKAVKSVDAGYIVGGAGLAMPVIPEFPDDAPPMLQQCQMDPSFSGVRGQVSRWATDFLDYCRDHSVSLDFLSFHAYSPSPYRVFYEYGGKLAAVLKQYPGLSPLYGTPKLATNEWSLQLTDDVGIRNLCGRSDGTWNLGCVGRLESYKTAWKSAHHALAFINMLDQGLELNASYSALYQNVPERTTEETKADVDGSCRYFTLACSDAERNAYHAFKGLNRLAGTQPLAVSGSDHMTMAAAAGRKDDGSIVLVIAHFDPKAYRDAYPITDAEPAMGEKNELAYFAKKFPDSPAYGGFRVDLSGLGWKSADRVTYTRYLVDDAHKLEKVAEKVLAGGATLTLSEASSAPSVQVITLSLRDEQGSIGDIEPPAASIASPADGALVSGTVAVAAAASDNVGVAKVEFYVDGALKSTDTASPYGFAWDTTGLSGSHTLQAKAYDAAGNVGVSAGVGITVQNGIVTPVYFTIVSHNEEYTHSDCYRYLGNPSLYLRARENLRKLAGMIKEKGAKYDWQSDWTFLEAARLYENTNHVPASSWTATNNKNIVRWMKEDMGISIDPHAHETEYGEVDKSMLAQVGAKTYYNYADVSWLIEQLGVKPSAVIGGSLYFPPDNYQGWERFRSPIRASASTDASYTWRGEILWGAGVLGHAGDDEDASGVWRPRDRYHWGTHDPSGNVIYMGGQDAQSTMSGSSRYVFSLLEDIAAGEAPAGKLYTVGKIIAPECFGDKVIPELAALLDQLEPYVAQGRVVHATVPEIVEVWKTRYGSEGNRYDPTPPQATISSPTAGARVSGVVTLSAAAAHATTVKFKLDGADLGTELAAMAPTWETGVAVATAAWDTRRAPNGTHALTVEAKNAAGSVAISSPVVFTVYNDIPSTGTRPTAPAYGLFQLYGDEYRQFREAMGFSLPDYWSFVDRHVARLDVRFTRTNTILTWGLLEPVLGGGYDWDNETKTDPVIRATYAPAPGKQMDMLLVLEPARTPGVPAESQKSYPYGREAEWQAFVRAAVERYDGDGAGDADPRVRVKHWQVMNEPFANLQTGLLTPEEYAALVKLTAQAVREADPEARVVLGDTGEDAAKIVPLLEGGGWFDAVDTHFYPAGDDYLSPAVGGLRRLLDEHGYPGAEVWMAEMGVYLHAPGGLPERSAADQARLLVKAMLANRALGATRILLVNLVSWSDFGGDPQSLFNFMGLVSSGKDSGDAAQDLGRERPAYYAYQRLIAATETSAAELVGPRGSPSDPSRVIEFRRRADGQAFFVAWSDGADATLELPWSAPRARVVNLVPDAAGAFTETSADAAAGLSVTVGRDPLLLEPADADADANAPAVSITAPARKAGVSGMVRVTVEASDDIGVARVELYVDGVLQDGAQAEPYSFRWDATAVSTGAHHLWAKAYDAAGNAGTSEKVKIAISARTVAVPPGGSKTVVVDGEARHATVSLSSGTFASPVTVTVAVAENYPEEAASGLLPTGVGVRITVAEKLQPSRFVAIEATYQDSDIAGLEPGKLVLARYDETAARWLPLKSTVDRTARKVTGWTDHFSLFQVMGTAKAAPPAGELGEIRIYPNPFYPNRGQSKVTLDGLPAGSRVRIYTLLGELVWEGTADAAGAAQWPGANRAGRPAASDIYRARVDSGGRSRLRKLSVIR